MKRVFRPEARAEALAARDWYERRSPGLGLEFARCVDAALAAIARSPHAFPLIHGGCRQILLRKFPYSLVYRAGTEELLVVAIFHHRRNPRGLGRRVGA